ncbi:TetR/AcrR family transcriptional regulator [Parvibium lacunae]|uniref:TetR/AcrR family transcriptional regulator n=2 Tax=Parvibium lacunae TaxID=1888893 RepID=A0A368L211_9BURK|nr:TetR/AcrR family transcriptional regulator [Parvibium lacunae]
MQNGADTSAATECKRWTRRKEARPAELLEAALDVFVAKGFASTRLDDIAAKAGVSKGTLYLYYRSKEALLKAVVQQNIVPIVANAQQLADQYSGPSADLFRLLILGWWQQFGNTKLSGIPKLLVGEANNFPELAQYYHDQVIQPAHQLMGSVIARGIAAGEFAPCEIPTTVHVLFAPMVMLSLWHHSFGPCCPDNLDPIAYLNRYLTLTLTALSHPNQKLIPDSAGVESGQC